VGTIVLCGGFSFVLAYSMFKSWWDTPLCNLAFWTLIALIAVLLGQTKKKGRTRRTSCE
jgi:hypothetical protein